jgi:PAS domain S-box-containing protein
MLSPSQQSSSSPLSDSEQVTLLQARNAELEKELKECKLALQQATALISDGQRLLAKPDLDRPPTTNDLFEQDSENTTLEESELKFRSIFEQAAVSLSYVDLEGRFRLFNQNFCEMLGYSPEELLTKTFMEVTHPEDTAADTGLTQQVLSGKLPHFAVEKRYIRKDGSLVWVDITVSLLRKPDGQPKFLFAVIQNISQRKQAQDDLKQLNQELENRVQERTRLLEWSNEKLGNQELLFRRIFENAPIAMAIVDLHTLCFTKVNQVTCDILGYSAHELTGFAIGIPQLLHPDEGANLADIVQQLVGKELYCYRHEKRCIKKTGEVIWLNLTITLLSTSPNSPPGSPAQGFCMAEDITERRQAEIALRTSELRYKRLFESNVVGMYFLRLSGEIIDANDLFLKMLGYTRQELEAGKLRWDELTPPDYAALDQQVILEVHKTGLALPWEKEYFRKDGSRLPVLSGGGLIEGSNEGIAFCIDITKQRAAQHERDLVEERLKASLQDKEVLLKEIHHRVKNNMQMVSSLLSLQAGSIQDPHVLLPFRESQNRVKAMALIHEKLYQSTSLARVDFSEYIHALATDLLSSYSNAWQNIKLYCDIAEVELDIDTVIPCGLIVNELVSNVIKYAFPPYAELHDASQNQASASESPQGEIRISFALNDANHQYVLTVADNGVGIPESLDFRKTSSLGLQLVCALTDKLRGTLEVSCEQGTSVTLMFQKLSLRDE